MIRLIYPYQKSKRFYNYKYHQPESFFSGTLPSFLQTVLCRRQPTKAELSKWINESPLPINERSIKPIITWIGHATFLIQIGGLNIITDPVFGTPSRFFRRLLPAGIIAQQLPPIDLVLISHNHFDHMDKKSLDILKDRRETSFLVPIGDKRWFTKRQFANVHEYLWWEKYKIERDGQLHDVVCTFLPAFHWSGRGLFDKNKSLWGSWMISYDTYHIYFGGDSAHGPHFEQIGSQFPNITAALLPIGPGEPFKWMKHNHMNGEQAVKAFISLNAQQLIPMHWGTFDLSSEPFLNPINKLDKAWSDHKDLLKNRELKMLKVGERVEW